MYAVPKTPIFSAKNVELSQVSPYRFMLPVYRFIFTLCLLVFPFWYVIKKTKKSSNGAACSRFTPKIRAIYFLIIKLSAPRYLKKKVKGKGKP
jgi:hypothetical protein